MLACAAYVDLKAGKKPQIGFSSQVNTEQSFVPMKVKFVKASPSFNRGSKQIKKTERKAPERPVRPQLAWKRPRAREHDKAARRSLGRELRAEGNLE